MLLFVIGKKGQRECFFVNLKTSHTHSLCLHYGSEFTRNENSIHWIKKNEMKSKFLYKQHTHTHTRFE